MIIDITQELFTCKVFPGDPAPVRKTILSTENGDVCNLTEFSMCAHNGTHIDAPFHFLTEGKTVDRMPMRAFVGECYVARHEGDVTGADAKDIMARAESCGAGERILIAGKAVVTADAARIFAERGVLLLGNESQTVGPMEDASAVHHIMLGKGICLLEGVVLKGVKEGKYFLSAAPLNLGGCDGAPCRAYLIDEL